MSLVPTYALDRNGQWWRDPVLSGWFLGKSEWFICFDDDDPIEMVITQDKAVDNESTDTDTWVSNEEKWLMFEKLCAQILEKLGIEYAVLERTHACGRCYGPNHIVKFSFAFWIMNMATPLPVQWITGGKKVTEREMGEGVYYDFDLC